MELRLLCHAHEDQEKVQEGYYHFLLTLHQHVHLDFVSLSLSCCLVVNPYERSIIPGTEWVVRTNMVGRIL